MLVDMRYRLYDDYELDMELIGKYTKPDQIRNAGIDRIEETDGECYLLVKDLLTKELKTWEEFLEENNLYEA